MTCAYNFLNFVAHRFWRVTMILAFTGFLLALYPTLQLFKNISTDPIDLLSPKDPNVQSAIQIRHKLERGVRTSIIVESPSREANINILEDMTQALRSLPWIGRVELRKTGYDFFDTYKLLYLSEKDLEDIRDRIERKIVKEKLLGLYFDLEEEEDGGEHSDLSFKDLENKYQDKYADDIKSPYMESANGHIFSLTLESKTRDTSLLAASEFQDHVKAFVQTIDPKKYEPSMQIYLTGSTKVMEYRSILKDLQRVGLISGILIFLPLMFRFRNILHVAVIFAPLLIALPISFAITSLWIPNLNITTSFLFAILGGLGIENGIHIFSRYFESRSKGETRDKSIYEIFSQTGPAILTSVASVAITLLALVFNDFRGFSEFGLISGVGLWVILGTYILLMPALLIFLEHMKWLKFKVSTVQTDSKRLPISNLKQLRTILLVFFGFFTILSIISIQDLSFEYRSKELRAQIPETLKAREKQSQTTTRVNNPAALIVHSQKEAKAVTQAVKRI